tara:strand:- start:7355 stop:8347 length:993 start_codon:yes stop_codon:yes gene_type:complete
MITNPLSFENFWEVNSSLSFEKLALDIFNLQYKKNTVYRSFCDLINRNPCDVKKVEDIPHLPISFFKSKKVVSFEKEPKGYFSSSKTSGLVPSKHFYRNLEDYTNSFTKGFENFYGKFSNYVFLALLPSYTEQKNSSLIFMVKEIIQKSGNIESGFYLDNFEDLVQKINFLESRGQKTILLGVSFALLDLLECNRFHLKNTLIMETGGMKGKRKEITRMELHKILSEGFGCKKIHSEYGMTELLSQAYSNGDGIFECQPWMRVSIRENQDPFQALQNGQTGGINIIDLANRDSCAFIATDDIGKVHSKKKFEIMGRYDHSEARGCNLMVF